MNDFLLLIFVWQLFFLFFLRFYFFFFSKHQPFFFVSSVFFVSRSFFVSLFRRSFFVSLFSSSSLEFKRKNTTTILYCCGDPKFHFPQNFVAPSCFSFERREKERERKSAFVLLVAVEWVLLLRLLLLWRRIVWGCKILPQSSGKE